MTTQNEIGNISKEIEDKIEHCVRNREDEIIGNIINLFHSGEIPIENQCVHCCRKNIINHEYSWEQLSDIIFKLTGNKLSSDAIRKRFKRKFIS